MLEQRAIHETRMRLRQCGLESAEMLRQPSPSTLGEYWIPEDQMPNVDLPSALETSLPVEAPGPIVQPSGVETLAPPLPAQTQTPIPAVSTQTQTPTPAVENPTPENAAYPPISAIHSIETPYALIPATATRSAGYTTDSDLLLQRMQREMEWQRAVLAAAGFGPPNPEFSFQTDEEHWDGR